MPSQLLSEMHPARLLPVFSVTLRLWRVIERSRFHLLQKRCAWAYWCIQRAHLRKTEGEHCDN